MREMRAHGVEPDEFVFCPLIEYYHNHGDAEGIREVFVDALKHNVPLELNLWSKLEATCGPAVCSELDEQFGSTRSTARPGPRPNRGRGSRRARPFKSSSSGSSLGR